VWEHFYRISQLPRCSNHEEKVRQYVVKLAEQNGLPYKIDAAGNIAVKKPAAAGLDTRPSLALQAHLDMVCEKDRETVHDFNSDPIQLKKTGDDWISARGTTLGADNGIGLAVALAILENKELRHGPLECLLTVGEEIGLKGAHEISSDMLDSLILLNLDSEQDNTLYIGCAGSRNTDLVLTPETEARPNGYRTVLIRVDGLLGGHSGLDIHHGRANAIKLLVRCLWQMLSRKGIYLAYLEGGSSPNAIPREASAMVFLLAEQIGELKKEASEYQAIYKAEYKLIEIAPSVTVEEQGFIAPATVFSSLFQDRLLNLLFSIPNGVMAMDPATSGLVRTSTNLAFVTTGNGQLKIGTKQRSSLGSELIAVSDMIRACGLLARAKVQTGGDYPPWQPNFDSPLLNTVKSVYGDLYGKEPEIKTMHGGVECAILGDKFPGIDMLSVGPTILGAHTCDERVQISTVVKLWDVLTEVLVRVSS